MHAITFRAASSIDVQCVCLLAAMTDRQTAFDRLQHRREQSKQRRLQKGKEAALKQVMRARWSSLKR